MLYMRDMWYVRLELVPKCKSGLVPLVEGLLFYQNNFLSNERERGIPNLT
jgi:hypothetical protein